MNSITVKLNYHIVVKGTSKEREREREREREGRERERERERERAIFLHTKGDMV